MTVLWGNLIGVSCFYFAGRMHESGRPWQGYALCMVAGLFINLVKY